MKARGSQSELGKTFAVSAAATKMAANASRPFSIRLSEAERQRLEWEAGPQPLGAYVKARLLANAAQRRPGRSFEDTAALGQALGRLGSAPAGE